MQFNYFCDEISIGENKQYLPTKRGFDHYLGIPYSHDMCPCLKCFPEEQRTTGPETEVEAIANSSSPSSCFGDCHTEAVSCPLFLDEKIIQQPVDLTTLTSKFSLAASTFIDKSVQENSPFFLYMAYHQTHHPQFAGTYESSYLFYIKLTN